MPRILGFVLVIATATPLAAQTQLPPASTARVDYDKDIKPLLEQKCYSCHGDEVQQSGLRLDRRQAALRGGDYGPVIVAGKSAESKLIKRLVDGDGGLQMPPTGALSADEIGLLRAWIDQGPEFRTEIADVPPRSVDPKVAALVTAVRTESASAVQKLMTTSEMVTSRDPAGSSLLHHAVAFGSLETVALLLDAKVDVNAKNRRGSTPLHWAVHDDAKVRMLLAGGAAVNARQADGRTPLYLTATLGNGLSTLKVLLEHGANPGLATTTGQTPLMASAIRGNVDALRLLIEKKADVNAKNGAGETALVLASANGSPEAVRLLLAQGADARIRTKLNETALGDAATAGVEETVKLLLDHGAEVNVRNIRGYSPLMLAASSETMPAGIIKLLLAKGADASYTGDYNETARDLAAKRGDTEAARLLGAVAKKPAPVTLAPSHARAGAAVMSQSVTRALTLLEKQSHNFIRIGGCNSCHAQDLVSAAAAVARSRGLAGPASIPQLPAAMMPPAERLMDLNVVAVTGVAWELFDFGMNGAPRNHYTDAAARLIKSAQTPEGNWNSNESRRPPMNAGDFQAAAIAVYSLKHYAPPAEQDGTNQAVAKAAAWMERTSAETTQDRAFRALGLAWSGNHLESAKTAARTLVAMQRSDGGWSQLPTLESDAYATGQALYALNVAGAMSASDPVYQKGIDYLLRTQAADGSWHVKSRSIWLQPYFESGFPYGQDQFISAAGSAWASIALAVAVEPTRTTVR